MNTQAIKNFLRRGYLYILNIEKRVYNFIRNISKTSEFKFATASATYIVIYGLMVNTILHYFWKFPFTAEGIFACGFLAYLIRYELVEWLEDLRTRR